MGRRKIKPKRKSEASDNNVIPFELPDRRATERTLAGFGGAFDGDDPSGQAQEIIWGAFESNDAKVRVAAARKALEVYPDCVDAYNLLAEHGTSIEQAYGYYLKAVEAGKRDLGEEFFEENKGYFWGLIETRPYMRALQGLAQCQVHMGEKAAAADCYMRILDLNPNDNQGVRAEVVPLLIELERDDEATAVLDRFGEDFASSAYNRALVEFRNSGESRRAQKLLDKAVKANKHVPELLFGKKRMPAQLPDYHGFGDANEAVIYVHEAAAAWDATPGALAWMSGAI